MKVLAAGALGSVAIMALAGAAGSASVAGSAAAPAGPIAATLTAQPGPATPAQTTAAPLSVPAKGTDPVQVNNWWQGLTPDQQQQVTNSNLAAIGSLDGIPAAVRDYANREVVSNAMSTDPSQANSLPNQINSLTSQRNDLQNQLYNLENPANPYTPTDETTGTLQNKIDNVNNQLSDLQTQMGGLQALQNKIDPNDPSGNNLTVPFPTGDTTASQPGGAPQMYLLGVDVPGAGGTSSTGQFIVAAGNPDTAQNVATIVTGMNSKLDSEFVNYYVGAASNLQGQATVAAPDQTTSVITWYGYNAPQGVGSASWAAAANAGAPALQQFQAGLYATNTDASNLNTTLVPHSYGSVVTGVASQLPGGLDANQVAAVGSPGMNVASADALAAGIGVVPGTSQIFAGKNTTDIISLAPGMSATGLSMFGDTLGHGTDPTSQGFGATVFDTGNGQPGAIFNPITGDYFTYSRAAHSEYFDWGNPALANLGNIVTGNFGAVTSQGTAALEQDLTDGKYSGVLPPSLANELGIPVPSTPTNDTPGNDTPGNDTPGNGPLAPGDTGIDGIQSWPTQNTTTTVPQNGVVNTPAAPAPPDGTQPAAPADTAPGSGQQAPAPAGSGDAVQPTGATRGLTVPAQDGAPAQPAQPSQAQPTSTDSAQTAAPTPAPVLTSPPDPTIGATTNPLAGINNPASPAGVNTAAVPQPAITSTPVTPIGYTSITGTDIGGPSAASGMTTVSDATSGGGGATS